MGNMAKENAASMRINGLLDAGSFVEIGGAITARTTDFNMQEKDTPADGVITGYGVIDGNLVYVYSQDASVLNGAIGEMHAKKIANLYDLAMKTGAPVIGLIDSAGLRLQEATDALNGFGEIYFKQAMASGVIPQITAIFGACGGGLAVIPGMADFTFMESKGKLFVNAPNALEGNEISKCDSSSAVFQSAETGIVDYVGDEEKKPSKEKTFVKKEKKESKEEVVVKEEKLEEKPELDLNILTVTELRDLAKKREIKGYSKMKKEELIENLK